jgi:hypothetical protein
MTIDDAMRDEVLRDRVRFDICCQEFTSAMETHQLYRSRTLSGEYVYYLTEMWFTWPNLFGYDAEHGYILN